MRVSRATRWALPAFLLQTATLSAATTSYCLDGSEACYQWGVPEATASSGSGNIYFQLQAPTKYQWVGLGIGSGMRGAHIFLMYQDGNGNVTLSTRAGKGHVEPEHVDMSDVTLLAGSGVDGDTMTANVRCGSCSDLDLSGSAGWIGAYKAGDPLDSTDPNAEITIHDDKNAFQVDMSKASMSSDSNPFLGSSSSSSGSGGSSGSSGGGDGAVTSKDSSDDSQTLPRAHGIIMTIVFVAGYPIGSSVMPLIGNWLLHASWQAIVFLAMWAGLGVGYYASKNEGDFFKQSHTRLGVIVVALMTLQPLMGLWHHLHYRKHQGRGLISYVHMWYGRCLMILGMINGGLGLQLANASRSWIIAYSVLAGVFALLYAGAAGFGASRRRRQLNGPAGRRDKEARSGTSGSPTAD